MNIKQLKNSTWQQIKELFKVTATVQPSPAPKKVQQQVPQPEVSEVVEQPIVKAKTKKTTDLTNIEE